MWKCTRCDMVVYLVGFLQFLEVATSFGDGNYGQSSSALWSPERSRLISRDLECSRPDFYVCEEPPVSPLESGKLCNYRGVPYLEHVYRWLAGRGCLHTPGSLYAGTCSVVSQEPPVSPLESGKLCNYRGVPYLEHVYRWLAGRGCLHTPGSLYAGTCSVVSQEPPVSPLESGKLCNYRGVPYLEHVYRWLAGRGCLHTPGSLYAGTCSVVSQEPPVSPLESGKLCNYRGVPYLEHVYRWVAGRGCLLYIPDFLYVNGTNTINLNSACMYGTSYAPCLEMIKADGTCGCFPFDPSFPQVTQAVQEAILSTAHGRWERCYRAAADCCTDVMSDADVSPEDGFCGATFDGWMCWEAAETNTVVSQVCPEFAYTNTGPTCHHFSTKNCTDTGSWDIQTDYTTCSISPRLVRRNRYYIWVLAASTLLCTPAIVVFFFYRRLRVTRVALHRNLLIAVVARNVLVIVTRSEIYLDELMNASDTTLSAHAWPCRALAVAERIAINFVFVCMLVEGVYLHRVICAVFKKELSVKLLYGVGTVIALVPVAVWATVMALLDDHSCWVVYTVAGVQWALDGPRIAILLANTLLFADILRVLLTKIRNSENANQLSTAKATLFLMPLFGVQFLITAYRPVTDSCSLEQGYYIFVYAMEAIQGVLVAILYCYANKEVHNLVKQTYRNTEDAIVSRVRRDSTYQRANFKGNSTNRRDTYSTNLDNPPLTPQPFTQKDILFPDNRGNVTILDPIPESGIDNRAFNASENIDNKRFERILDPILESSGCSEAFNASEASESDSGYSPPDNVEYADTDSKTSTGKTDETVECHEWIKCVSSPSSSIYDNSLNEYEIKYLEEKIPTAGAQKGKTTKHIVPTTKIDPDKKIDDNGDEINTSVYNQSSDGGDGNDEDNVSFSDFVIPEQLVEGMDGSEMFEQLMREAVPMKREGRVSARDAVVVLDPDALSPNRSDNEKIIFVDE